MLSLINISAVLAELPIESERVRTSPKLLLPACDLPQSLCNDDNRDLYSDSSALPTTPQLKHAYLCLDLHPQVEHQSWHDWVVPFYFHQLPLQALPRGYRLPLCQALFHSSSLHFIQFRALIDSSVFCNRSHCKSVLPAVKMWTHTHTRMHKTEQNVGPEGTENSGRGLSGERGPQDHKFCLMTLMGWNGEHKSAAKRHMESRRTGRAQRGRGLHGLETKSSLQVRYSTYTVLWLSSFFVFCNFKDLSWTFRWHECPGSASSRTHNYCSAPGLSRA